MTPDASGCIRLGSVAGITVYLHWSWLIAAVILINHRSNENTSLAMSTATYLTLFGIVLLHEFGHAFACRQVGGRADRIVLWPLGGIAFVSPPPRPGALLWSIAAGPLVNAVLLLPTYFLWQASDTVLAQAPQAQEYCMRVFWINAGLLIFNMLPVYPLDGGQILHALLWFPLGRARSLQICASLGLLAAGAVILLAFHYSDYWLLLIAFFVAYQAWLGLRQVRTLTWLQPAIDHLQQAVNLVQRGNYDDALTRCERALELMPASEPARAEALALRGLCLLELGEPREAIADFDVVLRHHPQAVQQYVQRGQAHAELGDHGRAEQDLQRALQLDGNQVEALSQLAWLWATCPSAAHRHGARAVEYATRACELSGWRDPYHLETLAAACAEAGDFPAALKWQQKAQEDRAYREHLGARADERVQMYAQGLPYRAARRGELPA